MSLIKIRAKSETPSEIFDTGHTEKLEVEPGTAKERPLAI